MDFELTPGQVHWQRVGTAVGELCERSQSAAEIIAAAGERGLLDPVVSPLERVLCIDAASTESVTVGMALALHMACLWSLDGASAAASLRDGSRVGALALSSDALPQVHDARLSGQVRWVMPATPDGLAIVGAQAGEGVDACALSLGAPGVTVHAVTTVGLPGLRAVHLECRDVQVERIGPPMPVMARVRLCMAAVGLGLARRAVREALACARGTSRGAGGEQTAQGLIADAATELDAAVMLTWQAALEDLSLSRASLAKLAATGAALRAVERAAQVVGAESFAAGHVIERLTQDVRAIELFAGRNEALREAVAVDLLEPGYGATV